MDLQHQQSDHNIENRNIINVSTQSRSSQSRSGSKLCKIDPPVPLESAIQTSENAQSSPQISIEEIMSSYGVENILLTQHALDLSIISACKPLSEICITTALANPASLPPTLSIRCLLCGDSFPPTNFLPTHGALELYLASSDLHDIKTTIQSNNTIDGTYEEELYLALDSYFRTRAVSFEKVRKKLKIEFPLPLQQQPLSISTSHTGTITTICSASSMTSENENAKGENSPLNTGPDEETMTTNDNHHVNSSQDHNIPCQNTYTITSSSPNLFKDNCDINEYDNTNNNNDSPHILDSHNIIINSFTMRDDEDEVQTSKSIIIPDTSPVLSHDDTKSENNLNLIMTDSPNQINIGPVLANSDTPTQDKAEPQSLKYSSQQQPSTTQSATSSSESTPSPPLTIPLQSSNHINDEATKILRYLHQWAHFQGRITPAFGTSGLSSSSSSSLLRSFSSSVNISYLASIGDSPRDSDIGDDGWSSDTSDDDWPRHDEENTPPGLLLQSRQSSKSAVITNSSTTNASSRLNSSKRTQLDDPIEQTETDESMIPGTGRKLRSGRQNQLDSTLSFPVIPVNPDGTQIPVQNFPQPSEPVLPQYSKFDWIPSPSTTYQANSHQYLISYRSIFPDPTTKDARGVSRNFPLISDPHRHLYCLVCRNLIRRDAASTHLHFHDLYFAYQLQTTNSTDITTEESLLEEVKQLRWMCDICFEAVPMTRSNTHCRTARHQLAATYRRSIRQNPGEMSKQSEMNKRLQSLQTFHTRALELVEPGPGDEELLNSENGAMGDEMNDFTSSLTSRRNSSRSLARFYQSESSREEEDGGEEEEEENEKDEWIEGDDDWSKSKKSKAAGKTAPVNERKEIQPIKKEIVQHLPSDKKKSKDIPPARSTVPLGKENILSFIKKNQSSVPIIVKRVQSGTTQPQKNTPVPQFNSNPDPKDKTVSRGRTNINHSAKLQPPQNNQSRSKNISSQTNVQMNSNSSSKYK